MTEKRDSKEDSIITAGGTMTLPDGYFVHKVNMDAQEPYCVLKDKDYMSKEKFIKVLIPKSFAYYVTTHFCGSKKMHEDIRANAIEECQNRIKKVLGLDG